MAASGLEAERSSGSLESLGGQPPERKGATAWLGLGLDRFVEALVVLGLLTSLGSTLFQVVVRYGLNSPVTWSEELSRLAFLWLVFLGAAVAIRRGEHVVSVDSLVALAPMRAQRAAAVLSSAIVALTCLVLVFYGWRVLEGLTSISIALRWPVRLFYAAVVAGAAVSLVNLMRARPAGPARHLEVAIIAVAAALFWVFFAGEVVPAPAWDTGLVVNAAVVFFILVGVPVAFSIAFGAVLGYWLSGSTPFMALPHQMTNGVDSFLLLAIPFFLLAGQFMNEGGITRRLIALASVLVGHITGGLAQVNILTNLMMGGLSGSAAGDCAGITKILVPSMVKHGYDRAFSCGVTSSASILANLVPPSIMFMVYGAVAEVSIGRLFLAGIIPGVVLALAMMAAAYAISLRRGYKGLEQRASVADVAREAKSAFWALPMPVIIVGGMRMGVVTPTEAAAVAAVYAFVVGALIYRELKLTRLPSLLLQAGLETAMIMLILGASQPFSWVLTAEQIPQQVAHAFASFSDNPLVILLMLNIFLLIVGLPLEAAPGVIILVPILAPVIVSIGMDPVHFGVVIVTNLLLGSLTPPVGVLVFISAGIAGVPAARVFKEALPILGAALVALLLITYIPQLSLFLPNLLMGVAK